MALGVVKNFDTWKFQESYVERVMDNAAYTAAHPDDTLVMAGPARKHGLREGGAASLLAIGMLQAVNFTQTKPTQPMMAIGSGRSFYVSGKAQTQWSMGRLFVNGRNLPQVRPCGSSAWCWVACSCSLKWSFRRIRHRRTPPTSRGRSAPPPSSWSRPGGWHRR